MKPVAPFNISQPIGKRLQKPIANSRTADPRSKRFEGLVWGVLSFGRGDLARFETTEEAERVFLAAGFKFIEAGKGFRA